MAQKYHDLLAPLVAEMSYIYNSNVYNINFAFSTKQNDEGRTELEALTLDLFALPPGNRLYIRQLFSEHLSRPFQSIKFLMLSENEVMIYPKDGRFCL